jgi:predicted DNA-binding transcriptional regulator AlpA
VCIEIKGVEYFSTTEVLKEAGISRQTLWRWRQEGRVPDGHRFRNGQVLFSGAEYQEILAYANHLEPGALTTDPAQLGLTLKGRGQ